MPARGGVSAGRTRAENERLDVGDALVVQQQADALAGLLLELLDFAADALVNERRNVL